MLRPVFLLLLAALSTAPINIPLPDGPAYTSDGQLQFPQHYREWIYLTSGVNMSYDPRAQDVGHTIFDNVFVNPSAYQSFQQTGTWPDGTVMVLEVRGGESGKSINKHGQTQSVEVMDREIHVKDARLPGGWGFFSFDKPTTARLTPRPASCYTCHEEHAAVDTTFVQFYPTLIGVAQEKATLSPAYLKELSVKPPI